MTLQAHRNLAIASVLAGLLAYRSLAIWNPDPHGDARFRDWLFSSVDAIPQMYFFLAAALAWRNRRLLRREMDGTGSPLRALLPLALGAALFVWGHSVGAPDLILWSFVLVSIGAAWVWFGTGFAAAWSIPCVILAFAYPIPAVVTNQIFYPLRLWTADQAAALLGFVDFPVYQEGNVIYGTNVVAQIIDSCTGLRAIEILTLATFLYVQWSPANRYRGWLLVALAPPIAYGFNLLRVCLIIPDPTSDLSATHTVQGWLAFFGAFTTVVLVDRLLGRLFSDPSAASTTPARVSAHRQSTAHALGLASSRMAPHSIALAALLFALAGVSIWLPRWTSQAGGFEGSPGLAGPTVQLPLDMDGWLLGEAIALDRDFLWSVRFAQYANRPYLRDGEAVELFVGYDDRRHRDRSLLTPKNAFPGRGWEVEDRNPLSVDPLGARVERVVAHSGRNRILTYHWYEGTNSVAIEALRAVFATDQSPWRRDQRARAIRIGTQIGAGAIGEAEGDRKLQAFALALARNLPADGSSEPTEDASGEPIARPETSPAGR